MNLSNDLVNKFVEITNDETPNKEGSTAYGVTVQYGDRMYVKLDGSDLLTPVETTSAIKSGERVTVLIKDHNATVTGNLSDPSASSKDLTDVGDKIAEVDILIADKVDTKILVAETARIEELIATKASIGQLEADRAEIEHLIANKAEITDLEAINADIKILDAEVADIETLVNGHLTSDNIQSLVLTSDKVTVDDAFIKDAMIANVSANKITSGQINTSLVSISSEDGSMTLNGSTQQFKDSEGTVRIQIGKDAEGNFTFCLFSQDGVGILLDEEGIHAGAVPDGLIVNDMVADNANISGGKLDINSVITSINNGTTTIDSSRIYLDDESQSLKVAFNRLKTKVETIENVTVDGDLSSVIEQVTSNTTNINIMQGQISSLISNTTITKENGQVVQLKDEYNSTKNTVDSHTTKIGSLETTVDSVSSKQTKVEQDLAGFRSTVTESYVTKDSVDQGVPNMIPHTDFGVSNSVENWRCWNSADLYLTTSTWDSDTIIGGMVYRQRVMRLRWNASSANVAGHTYSTCTTNQRLTLKANTQYTFSVYLHVGGNGAKQGYFRFYAMKADGTSELCYNSPKYAKQSDYRKIEVTFTTIAEAAEYELRFYIDAVEGATENAFLTIHQPMLNIGTTAAIWRARTEDMETSIMSSTQTKIDESANGILLEVSSNYTTKNEINDRLSSYSTITAMNSAINATKNDITLEVNQAKTMATKNYNNLIVNSAIKKNKDSWYINQPTLVSAGTSSSDKMEDNHTVRLSCNEQYVYMNSTRIRVNPGETYTLGVWGLCAEYNDYLRFYSLFCETDTLDNSYISSPILMTFRFTDNSNWQYKTATFTIPEGTSYLSIKARAQSLNNSADQDGRAWFSCLMLVKGDTIAGWTDNSNDNYEEFSRRMNAAEVKITPSAIISTVSSTYATKDELSVESSKITQNANKISWVVKSGSSASNMTLTDRVYTLVSQNITLKAESIDLHGYVSANSNFSIDTKGNMTAKNGTFTGSITGSTLQTSPVAGKYVFVKTSDVSVWNGSNKVVSLGLKSMNADSDTIEAPSLYMGADGIRLDGGTNYADRTGRYYGRLVAYGHDNLQDEDSSLAGVPYLELNFNTKFTSDNGNPTASQIRMIGNGDLHVAAVDGVEIRSHHSDNAFLNGGERVIARFTARRKTDYYTDCMQIRAISNVWNGSGLVFEDRFYGAGGYGYDSSAGGWLTSVSLDSALGDDGTKYRAFKPIQDGYTTLGRSNARWDKVYAQNGTISTSDRRAKENITYLTNVANPRVATDTNYVGEVVDFIKNIPFATYNMIDRKESNVGFILQDLIEMNPDLANELLLDAPVILKGHVDDDIPLLGYREANYMNMLAISIQYLLKKVEELEGK